MVNKLTVASFSSPERDVRLDLFSGGVHVLREAGDLEDGFLVPRGRHDVGVRLLLNALDGRALRTHDEADHSVRDTYLRGRLPGLVGDELTKGEGGVDVVLRAGGANLREVVGGGENLAFGQRDVLLPPRYHEHRLLAADRSLDVGVGLGAEGLDLAT